MLSKEEQKQIIKDELKKHPLVEGGQCFVVHKKWLDTWKTFVAFDSQMSASTRRFTMVAIPPPVSNRDMYMDPKNPTKLRVALSQGFDYEILPVSAGKKLLEWYGGGPEIICDVIKTVFIMRSLEPDLYPLELQVYRSSAMQDPISVQAKKSMTIAELRDLVCKKFQIDPDNVTLFKFDYRIKGTELKNGNSTVDSFGVPNVLLAEEQNHPYDRFASISTRSRSLSQIKRDLNSFNASTTTDSDKNSDKNYDKDKYLDKYSDKDSEDNKENNKQGENGTSKKTENGVGAGASNGVGHTTKYSSTAAKPSLLSSYHSHHLTNTSHTSNGLTSKFGYDLGNTGDYQKKLDQFEMNPHLSSYRSGATHSPNPASSSSNYAYNGNGSNSPKIGDYTYYDRKNTDDETGPRNGDYTYFEKNSDYSKTEDHDYTSQHESATPRDKDDDIRMMEEPLRPIYRIGSSDHMNYSFTSSYSSDSRPIHSWSAEEKGLCGLINMGNTCYMNSSLQCLMRSPPILEYFKSGTYKKDINRTNPLGMKGEIAQEFAKVMNETWDTQGGGAFQPRSFADTLRRFAPQFEAGMQHDAHELLAYLLDGIHEDLNRVREKPQTTNIEGKAGDKDDVVAKLAWETHLRRNNSIIVDWFQGQLKSTVVCLKCKRTSLTFEAFMTLSLPLKSPVTEYTLRVVVEFENSKRMRERHGIVVHKEMPIKVLKKKIAETLNNPGMDDTLHMASVDRFAFTYIYSDEDLLPEKEKAPQEMHAFEVKDLPEAEKALIPSVVVPVINRYSAGNFGPPFLMRFPSCPTDYESLIDCLSVKVLRFVKQYAHTNAEAIRITKSLFISIQQENPTTKEVIPVQDDKPVEILPGYMLILHWTHEAYYQAYDQLAAFRTMEYTSASMTAEHHRPKVPASVQDCLGLFTSEERLSGTDSWFCSSCKTTRDASKKMDIWRLPKVLILHLKRFSYLQDQRDKIDAFVDFPVKGLDMSSYVLGAQETPPVYDLFAVSNHYGSLGSGHYTTYAVFKDQWYCFDDSRVSTISESAVKSPAAYILYYIRRSEPG